jgi:hypothetical protein
MSLTTKNYYHETTNTLHAFFRAIPISQPRKELKEKFPLKPKHQQKTMKNQHLPIYPSVAIPLIQLSQFPSTSQTAEALPVLHHSIQIVQHCRTTFAGARHEKQSKTINRYEKGIRGEE